MFERYAENIKEFSRGDENTLAGFEYQAQGKLEVFYAPFDYINRSAKIAIFGITPGMHQAKVAINIAQQALASGSTHEDAMRLAKQAASFSGPMRANLVSMLDHLKINSWLNIESSANLFQDDCTLAHFNSALRYPVFIEGKNYSGRSPKMLNHPVLMGMIEDILVDELRQLGSDTLLVPLGSSVEEALTYAAIKAGLKEHQVLKGMPHPSGANIERIQYFLGQKAREDLSIKVNPDKIECGRELAMKSIAAMRSAA